MALIFLSTQLPADTEQKIKAMSERENEMHQQKNCSENNCAMNYRQFVWKKD
jgi:hypothetical protein